MAAVASSTKMRAFELLGQYYLVRLALRVGGRSAGWFIASVLLPFVVLGVSVCAAAEFDGTFASDSVYPARGLLTHYGTLSNLVAVPITFLLGIYLIHSVCSLFNSAVALVPVNAIGALRALRAERERFETIVRVAVLEHRFILVLLRMIGIYALIVNAQSTRSPEIIYGSDVWDSSAHLAGYIAGRVLLGVAWIYVFPVIGYWLLASVMTVRRVASILVESSQPIVSPFSQDRCGGFRALGECMLAASYVAVPLLTMVVAHAYTHVNFYGTLAIAAALTAAAVASALFLPFLALHRFLTDWKRSQLERINRGLSVYDPDSPTPGGDSVPHLRLLAQNVLLTRIEQMNTWPYSPVDRLRWLGPALPIMASLGIKVLTS